MLNLGIKRVSPDELELSIWKFPDEGALSGKVGDIYRSRKKAIELYLVGATDEQLRVQTGQSLGQTYRLIRERCLSIHPDGEVWGWRGLVPWLRINSYQRKKKVDIDRFGMGGAGALGSLLNKYPELRKKFEQRILGPSKIRNRVSLVRNKKSQHHRWFINELRELGLEVNNEWPFNTEKLGYVSICKYINSVWEMNPLRGALVVGGPDNQRKLLTGDGVERPVDHLFQRVEMDAHKIDGRFSVLIPQPTGGYIQKIVHRLWVVVIIEVVSRAVIGYHFSMRKEVSKLDVLRAIKTALTKWKRPQISFGDHAYLPEAGLPSSFSDELVGVCWDETSVDGSLAETCESVREILRTVVTSVLLTPNDSFAIRRSKDDRPFIETFFRALSSRGFQQLSNTTGSKPQKKAVKNPDEVALTSQFQFEYAEELLAVLIANYNATSHSSLGGRSPLEYLKFKTAQQECLRYVDAESVDSVVTYRKLCVVKGGYKSGRRPYVNFAHGRYTNNILAQRHDLVGQKIWVVNHISDDVRIVKASTVDGQSLQVLTVFSPWNKLPHSIEIRNSVAALISNEKLRVPYGSDAVEAFLNYCEEQPGKKLPVHPAYLEARRILGGVAAAMKVEVIEEIVPERSAPTEQSRRNINTFNTTGSKRQLPAPRKAAD